MERIYSRCGTRGYATVRTLIRFTVAGFYRAAVVRILRRAHNRPCASSRLRITHRLVRVSGRGGRVVKPGLPSSTLPDRCFGWAKTTACDPSRWSGHVESYIVSIALNADFHTSRECCTDSGTLQQHSSRNMIVPFCFVRFKRPRQRQEARGATCSSIGGVRLAMFFYKQEQKNPHVGEILRMYVAAVSGAQQGPCSHQGSDRNPSKISVLQECQTAEAVEYPVRKACQRRIVGKNPEGHEEAVFYGEERVQRAFEVRVCIGLLLRYLPCTNCWRQTEYTRTRYTK